MTASTASKVKALPPSLEAKQACRYDQPSPRGPRGAPKALYDPQVATLTPSPHALAACHFDAHAVRAAEAADSHFTFAVAPYTTTFATSVAPASHHARAACHFDIYAARAAAAQSPRVAASVLVTPALASTAPGLLAAGAGGGGASGPGSMAGDSRSSVSGVPEFLCRLEHFCGSLAGLGATGGKAAGKVVTDAPTYSQRRAALCDPRYRVPTASVASKQVCRFHVGGLPAAVSGQASARLGRSPRGPGLPRALTGDRRWA